MTAPTSYVLTDDWMAMLAHRESPTKPGTPEVYGIRFSQMTSQGVAGPTFVVPFGASEHEATIADFVDWLMEVTR